MTLLFNCQAYVRLIDSLVVISIKVDDYYYEMDYLNRYGSVEDHIFKITKIMRNDIIETGAIRFGGIKLSPEEKKELIFIAELNLLSVPFGG